MIIIKMGNNSDGNKWMGTNGGNKMAATSWDWKRIFFIYIGRIVDDVVYIAYLQSMGLQQLHVKLNEISNKEEEAEVEEVEKVEEEEEEEGTLR